MELDLEKLNQEQREAVTHQEGPVLIVAGAGTGKTTVITKRIAWLINQGLAKPEEILAVTFTDKAAQEMEERVDKLLSSGYVDLWISTFHSFCQRVLQEHGLDIGLSTDFKLLAETPAWLLVRQDLNKFNLDYYQPLGNPTKFIHALITHFSRCKDQGIYPEDYLKYANSLSNDDEDAERIKEAARAYQTYQALLLENNLLDFGDLINYCLQLFQKRPLILKKYQKRFKYILVDEFQDTNWAQYELVKLLAAPKNNLTVCADDNQAIYKFRGASFGNIIQFRRDFPQAKQIFIIENYRSTQNILDLAYGFIQLNKARLGFLDKIDKKLLSNTQDKGTIEHLHFKTLDQEVHGVIEKIAKILEENGETSFNDFAILVRANSHAQSFSRGLERAGLPYQFVALKGLYSKPIILDTISYFKLLDNYHESAALYRILNLPFLEIPVEDIAQITQYSRKKSKSVYQSSSELSLINGLSSKTINQVNHLLGLIKKHTLLANEKNVSEVFIAFLNDSGYLKHLTKKQDRQSIDFINQFYDKIKLFEEQSIEPRLRNFMTELELELESGEQGRLTYDIEQGPEIIKIMTVHGAKGLEFKYVFLVNLVDRRFPTIEKKEPIEIPQELFKDIIPESDIHLEEERRLFYVGMTRAKRGLFFTSADDYGGARKKKLSRFLNEIGYKSVQPPALNIQRRALEEVEGTQSVQRRALEKRKLALPGYFSFTQFRAFANCPLQYKFAHIFKVPVRGRAAFSYGRTIHDSLFEFVKKTFKESVAVEEVMKIYEKKWVDEWYDSPEQKKKYYQLGKERLEGFYKDFVKSKPKIVFINDQPALEQGFNLKIVGETVLGKIDRIDKIDEGIELIDYKTGRAKEKLNSQDKEQLLIYQIAAEEVLSLKPQKLTYYYFDEGKELSFIGSDKDKQNQKEKMVSQIQAIKKSDFHPTPGWHCKFCDFKNICQYVQR